MANFNNQMTLDELKAMVPAIDFDKLMKDMEVPVQIENMILTQPRYMAVLQEFLTTTPIEDIKIIGSSSDHMIMDVADLKIKVGDNMRFNII